LNTIVVDTIGITLINNRFTLPAGTYQVFASATCFNVNRHQLRLRNVTNNINTVLGSTEYANNAAVSNRSFIDDLFTINSISSFELQHFIEIAQSGNGLGVDNSTANFDNVYACVKLIKYM